MPPLHGAIVVSLIGVGRKFDPCGRHVIMQLRYSLLCFASKKGFKAFTSWTLFGTFFGCGGRARFGFLAGTNRCLPNNDVILE